MPHIVCTSRGRRHRAVLFASCIFTLGAVPLSASAWAGCNSGNVGNTNLLTSANCQPNASGNLATAVGSGAQATGTEGSATGAGAFANGANATAIGFASGPGPAIPGATTIGAHSGANGSGHYSTAVVAGSSLFSGSQATGGYSVAIGGGDDSTFPGAKATGLRSIAIKQNSSSANFGTSVGFNTTTDVASTALGTDAEASGNGSTAVGRFAKASARSSLAVGNGAVASKRRSVAIGSGSVANAPDTLSVANSTQRRRIVQVACAIDNTDAVNLGQVRALINAAMRDALPSAVSQAPVDDLRREIGELRALVNRQQQEIAELRGRKAASLVE